MKDSNRTDLIAVTFLAAYTAVKHNVAFFWLFALFLAAYTAVKGWLFTPDLFANFLAAYTAVKERCYSSTP